MAAVICWAAVLRDHTVSRAAEIVCVFPGNWNEMPSKLDTSSRGGIPMPGDH
jgi:hypothetical protein